MTVKEVEKLLSVSSANIRFYEKEGLLTPGRKENNYRDYCEEDIQTLRKIILFRKLGFTIDEIRSLQKGEVSLETAATENIARLEKEIERLDGALKLTRSISDARISFRELDQNYYLELVDCEERRGEKFEDIMKDYLSFELEQFEGMWKRIFFHDFHQSRKRHGLPIAVGILLLICVVRGLSKRFLWGGSFSEGFLYPLVLFLAVNILITPIWFLAKKAPKAAGIAVNILLAVCFTILGAILLLLIVAVLNSFFHFWA